ncbi:AAA family ATPase, partial [Pinisolibacter sp.]|uniref:AAA family ATPase n=1 Tax=Pinisolibacter sp. TaxID=2172024 RepID=UPI002FDE56B8
MSMQIEALEIANFRLFREAKLTDLPRLAVVIGPNGSGKSTLFDVFSDLAPGDVLVLNWNPSTG